MNFSKISNDWANNAEQLTAWANKHLINRCDIFPEFKNNSWTKSFQPLWDGKLAAHFRGFTTLGSYTTYQGLCKFGGIDIDAHDNTADPELNFNFALEIYNELKQLGFSAYLEDSNGSGGYHVVILFNNCPNQLLFNLLQWLLRNKPEKVWAETFPKQREAKEVGNQLRLPGKHHKRDHYSRIWDGSRFVEGQEAIDILLALPVNDPSLIPQEARDYIPEKPAAPLAKGASKPFEGEDWRLQFAGNLNTLDITALVADRLTGKTEGQWIEIFCPWKEEHTTGDFAFVAEANDVYKWPQFLCHHVHCSERSLKDLLEYYGAEAVDNCCGEKFGTENLYALGEKACEIVRPIDPDLETQEPQEDKPPTTTKVRDPDLESVTTTTTAPNVNKTYAIGERLGMVRPSWIVKNVIRKNTVCTIFGDSGSGKTWITIDLCLCIATGTPFLGMNPVKQGKVYYIISEGADDFEYRVMAWCKKHNVAPPSPEYFVYFPGQYDFFEEDSVDQVLRDIGGRIQSSDVIVIDTLSKNFTGDADKNADLARYLRTMETLRKKANGATVVNIHHTGWANTERERGGKTLRDGVDTSIHVNKEGENRATMIFKKQKSSQISPSIPLAFDLIRMPEYDSEDEEVTGLVARYNDEEAEEESDKLELMIRKALKRGPKNQGELITYLQNTWVGDPPGKRVMGDLIKEIASTGSWLLREKGDKHSISYRLMG